MLRKPLPWLPGRVAFVSLCLDPSESPPLSRKMRGRREDRTTEVERERESEQETGKDRDRDRERHGETHGQREAEIKRERNQ